MNIGIINPFPFRPHNQNLVFIVNYLKKIKSNKLFFAECDGSPKICYNKLIFRNRPKQITCLGCRTFGLKSYLNEPFSKISIQNIESKSLPNIDQNLVKSSLFTYNRSESPEDVHNIENDQNFNLLLNETNKFKLAVKNWIDEKKLDAIIGFNGRIDLLKASRIACSEKSINFISVEMPWFGKGLLITPNESPSGVCELKKIYKSYRNKPLTESQIIDVFQPILKRFKKINKSEYKQFNKDHLKIKWDKINKRSTKKILFLPSSRSELLGDVNYQKSDWKHPLNGLKELINNNLVNSHDIIIKFHPIWSQKVFNKDGDNIIHYYESFCKENNICYIKSSEKVDSNYMISQADLIVINGSSSFFEASLIGKPVLSLSKAFYDCSEIALNFHSMSHFDSLIPFFKNNFKNDKKDTIRRTMRFLYTFKNRFTQFVNNVYYDTAFDVYYNYKELNNNILHTCKTGELIASDKTFARNQSHENKFLDNFIKSNMNLELIELYKDEYDGNKILRKPFYRIIDNIYRR